MNNIQIPNAEEIEYAASGLNQLRDVCFDLAKAKGSHEKNLEFGTQLMLTASKLGKALEAERNGKIADMKKFLQFEKANQQIFENDFKQFVKGTVEDELATALIRIMDTCGALQIDIESHVMTKLQYNAIQPPK